MCNSQEVEVKSVKHLEVNLDQSATGEYMVQTVFRKVNGKLNILYRQAKFLDQNIKKLQYSALFSHILIMSAHHGIQE